MVLATESWTTVCLATLLRRHLQAYEYLQREDWNTCILVNLVPIGSPVLLMRTHALSSNLINPPSLRCNSFFALTTTACLMSPLRTLFVMPKLDDPGDSVPKDLCFCTTTMMRSPRLPSDWELYTDRGLKWTYPRSLLLLSHNSYTLNDSCPGIVDAIQHRL